MLHKLHRKFILINMLCVLSVVALVLGILYMTTTKKNEEIAYRQLKRALEEPYAVKKEGFLQVQVFQTDFQFQVIRGSNPILEQSVMQDIADRIAQKNDTFGVLSAYEARYLYEVKWNGIQIAIMDCSHEKQGLQALLVNSILLFLLALVAFIIISWYLGKWALRPVDRAWKAQKQFISDASHELRTPITVILANTNILAHHPQDAIADQMKWIDNTQTEANRMKQLVENMLFLSRSDEQSLHYEKTRLNISDVLEQSTLVYEAIAYESKITLESEIESDLWIKGNEALIRQLITILMDNACKYCEHEKRIILQAKRIQNQVEIVLRNTAANLSQEDLEHLFERFYRSEKSRNRKQGGYGLGLSIAKTICEKHQGSIRVENKDGFVVFTVILPLEKA